MDSQAQPGSAGVAGVAGDAAGDRKQEGLSGREACDRLAFDLRWKAAAGLMVGAEAFHPTVLVGMRNRLRDSDRAAAVVRRCQHHRARGGTVAGTAPRDRFPPPLFDAVATQDTVIQLRAAIRKVAPADRVDPTLAKAVRAVLTRDDDYASLGKPPCDWDDPAAREALVDGLVKDAHAALRVLDDHELEGPLGQAGELLGLVAGKTSKPAPMGCFASLVGWLETG
ncbi:hypothetical protein A4G26_27755 [Mycobacterium kansasii]|nr:hypothetical protein A4G26_27755 [Mycobacterium kansasii]